MSYLTIFSSLKERALAQLAINLCGDSGFKEAAMDLEKPTYGILINTSFNYLYVTDPKLLSVYNDMIKNRKNNDVTNYFQELCNKIAIENKIEQWYTTIDEQCQRLTKVLPQYFRHMVHPWLKRIALEYLSFSRQQEILFGVSRYLLMDILTLGDWLEAGQIDHTKLVAQLLDDERLTVLQRYRMACMYCLPEHIHRLWKRLNRNKKLLIDEIYFREGDPLVILWSNYMNACKKVTVLERPLSIIPLQQAMCYGNRAVIKQAWKMIKEDTRQQTVIEMALYSLKCWKSVVNCNWKKRLIWNFIPKVHCEFIGYFNLPHHYSDLLHFFLSEMNDEQQLTFFRRSFSYGSINSVLECFLDWPFADYLLPTVKKLWGLIPKQEYSRFLLTLVGQYCFLLEYSRGKYYDEYISLFFKLWDATPGEYKQCASFARHIIYYMPWKKTRPTAYIDYPETIMEMFLLQLVRFSPFDEKGEVLFKRVLYAFPEEARLDAIHSYAGEEICFRLLKLEKVSFMNWFLEECLSKEKISSFKRKFMMLNRSHKICFQKLREGHVKYVEDLIDWSFELDAEKLQFKSKLVYENVISLVDGKLHLLK